MLMYPSINPVAIKIGSLKVHWYGLMYLIGIVGAWLLALHRAKRLDDWNADRVADLVFYVAIGVVVGGRLGYMLFYDFPDLWQHPLTLFKIWDGGMSFHGGFIGVAVSVWVFARRHQLPWLGVTDFVTPLVPLGLGAGRIGNFINDELWGRVTHVPWAMVFPSGGPLPRHPSQLYEFLLEGVILFILMWCYSSKPRPRGAVSALFLIAYGSFRFFVEFFRQPDPQLGFVAFGWMTRGQELSIPMVVLGVIVLIWSYKTRRGCV